MRRALFIFVVMIAWSSTAHAENAFDYFDRGAELYFEGDYAKSIVEFKRGYAIESHPMFMVNIALAYWRLDNLDEALEAVRAALEDRDELEPEVVAENQARQHVWTMIGTARERSDAIDVARREALAQAQVEADTQTTTDELPPAPEPEPLFSPLGWAGVGAGAAGVGLLVGWTVMEVGLNDDIAALEAAGEAGDRATYDDLVSDIQRKQTTARIFLFSGVGLLAAGGALVAVDLMSGSETDESVALGFGADGTIQVRGRF